MKTWNFTSNEEKKDNRNLNSPSSKIWEINKILEPTERDNFWVKTIKINLIQLLKKWEYTSFQEKIGMPHNFCDWLLWTRSLNYLIQYIVWIEDKPNNVLTNAITYIWNIFKYGKTKKEEPSVDRTKKENTNTNPSNLKNKNILEKNNLTPMFWNFPIWDIVSYPIIKDNETESYCCSKTARLNGLHFGISLPRWNAYTAWIFPTKWIIETIPKEKSWKKPNKVWWFINEWEFDLISNAANFADIYAESSTSYWHRAVAIRDTEWKRYVLDPYIKINGRRTLKPIKLTDYLTKWRKILKAHFYHSYWYIN